MSGSLHPGFFQLIQQFLQSRHARFSFFSSISYFPEIASFIDFYFSTMITTGDTKQCLSTLIFSKCQAFNIFSSSFSSSSWMCNIGLDFCLNGQCPSFSCVFVSVCFIVWLLPGKTGNLVNTFSLIACFQTNNC